MKRLLPILLLLCLLLPSCTPAVPVTSGGSFTEPPVSSTAGSSPPSSTVPPSSSVTPPPPVSTEEEKPVIDPDLIFTSSEASALYPIPTKNDGYDMLRSRLEKLKMDGSTSLIPMEAALLGALMDLPEEAARARVNHTTTWGSFYGLVGGGKNLIFSCPLSQEQRDYAKREEADLVEVPLAMEAFVFVVNADNPVDRLTQQQLRDIYSGKITNWKQVGGSDAPIIAYQRNRDSGSQNYMLDFMGDTPLTDAPSELRPATMHGLMDAISANDHSIHSIGYSVYAYAADMYQNGEAVKFIRVDGVAPSHATINDRSYPLLGYNYLIYNKNGSYSYLAEKFAEYALTDEAQLALAKARYVPVKQVDYDFETHRAAPYQGTGKGVKLPAETQHLYNQASLETTPLYYSVNGEIREIPQITNLADSALQEEINAYLRSSLIRLMKDYPALEKKASAEENESRFDGPWLSTTLTERNGYLGVSLRLQYDYAHEGGIGMCEYLASYQSESAVWDLINKKRLSVEEMFCEGTDIAPILNQFLTRESTLPYDGWKGAFYPMKVDFASLEKEADWWHVEMDRLVLDEDNPYFLTGVVLQAPIAPFVWDVQRDSRSCFREETPYHTLPYREGTDVMGLSEDGYQIPRLLPHQSTHAETINQTVFSYMKEHFSDLKSNDPYDWYGAVLGKRYYFVWAGGYDSTLASRDAFRAMVFDLETGKEISWTQILPKDWKAYATDEQILGIEQEITQFETVDDNLEDGRIRLIFRQRTEENGFVFYEDNPDLTLKIPVEDLVF